MKIRIKQPTEIASVAGSWGTITGTLSDQADLQEALDDKFTLPSLTSGSVVFSNGTTIAQDNANFFWDNTNKRLGIGSNSIPGGFGGVKLYVKETGSSTGSWKGRITNGGDNVAFLLGEYNSQAWLGAHNAALSAWADLYIQQGGAVKTYIGVSAYTPILTVDNSTAKVTVTGSSTTGNLVVTNTSSSGSISLASLLAASGSADTYFSVGRALTTANSTLVGHSTLGAANAYAFMTTYGRAASDFVVSSNGGNVGIGIAAPTNKLHVSGGDGITVAGGEGRIQLSSGSRTYQSDIVFGGYSSVGSLWLGAGFFMGTGVQSSRTTANALQKTSASNAHFFYTRYDRGLEFHTGISGTAGVVVADTVGLRGRIDPSGFWMVGENASGSPHAQLSVQTLNSAIPSFAIKKTNGSQYSNLFNIIDESGTITVQVTAASDVGIGLGGASPATKLHVNGGLTVDIINCTDVSGGGGSILAKVLTLDNSAYGEYITFGYSSGTLTTLGVDLMTSEVYIYSTSTFNMNAGAFKINGQVGFNGISPIAQPSVGTYSSSISYNGGTALTDTDTFDGYRIDEIVGALRAYGLLT